MPNASGGVKSSGIGVVVAVSLALVVIMSAGVWWMVARKSTNKVRPPAVVTWSTSATGYRSNLGKSISFHCPPKGRAGAVWGSGPYTDDSSVCTAAVHAGLITFAAGGAAKITVSHGQGSYRASLRHGVRTSNFGLFRGSFFFKQAKPTPVALAPPTTSKPSVTTWSTNPSAHRAKIGHRFDYQCPPKGSNANVWGSGPYTLDSSVCNAAVHAGSITRNKGGRVSIEITKGLGQYPGTSKHGVTTRRWAAFHTSFRIVGTPAIDALPAPP
jgi:LCCL domain